MWLWHAFVAMLLTAGISLSFKWLTNRHEPISMIIFVFKLAATTCLGIELLSTGSALNLTLTQWQLIAICGVLGDIGDIGQLRATAEAPNPGYAQAVIFTSPLLVLGASVFIPGFAVSLTWLHVVGASLCVIGTVLLTLPERG